MGCCFFFSGNEEKTPPMRRAYKRHTEQARARTELPTTKMPTVSLFLNILRILIVMTTADVLSLWLILASVTSSAWKMQPTLKPSAPWVNVQS